MSVNGLIPFEQMSPAKLRELRSLWYYEVRNLEQERERLQQRYSDAEQRHDLDLLLAAQAAITRLRDTAQEILDVLMAAEASPALIREQQTLDALPGF